MNNDNGLLSKIKSINPEILLKRIIKWDEVEFRRLGPFFSEHYWHGNASINPFRVVGTQHPDYTGMNWIEFLEKGKRMNINLKLLELNPIYYYEAKKKDPTMYFLSIDGGDLYIGEDGNHRTCISKALFYLDGSSILHGVVLNDYRVNWEFKKAFEELKDFIEKNNLPFMVEAISEIVSREDSGEWMREKFKNYALIHNLKKKTEIKVGLEGIEKFVKEHQKKKFWSFLRKN